jgi:hypothetical protein
MHPFPWGVSGKIAVRIRKTGAEWPIFFIYIDFKLLYD